MVIVYHAQESLNCFYLIRRFSGFGKIQDSLDFAWHRMNTMFIDQVAQKCDCVHSPLALVLLDYKVYWFLGNMMSGCLSLFLCLSWAFPTIRYLQMFDDRQVLLFLRRLTRWLTSVHFSDWHIKMFFIVSLMLNIRNTDCWCWNPAILFLYFNLLPLDRGSSNLALNVAGNLDFVESIHHASRFLGRSYRATSSFKSTLRCG